jgi:hypothetical protein
MTFEISKQGKRVNAFNIDNNSPIVELAYHSFKNTPTDSYTQNLKKAGKPSTFRIDTPQDTERQ